MKTKGDVDAGNSRRPVSTAGNATRSARQEEDSATCIRRRRLATQSDDDPERRANETNELSTTVDTRHVVPSTW